MVFDGDGAEVDGPLASCGLMSGKIYEVRAEGGGRVISFGARRDLQEAKQLLASSEDASAAGVATTIAIGSRRSTPPASSRFPVDLLLGSATARG